MDNLDFYTPKCIIASKKKMKRYKKHLLYKKLDA